MSKIKLLSVAVIGLLVINLGMLAFLLFGNQRPGPPRDLPGREGPADAIIRQLHFDDAQVSEYEKLIQQHRAAIRTLDAKMMNAKNDLYHSLTQDGNPGKDSLQLVLAELHKEIETTHYDHFLAIKKLCRPEQQKYFNDLAGELARYFSPKPPPGRER